MDNTLEIMKLAGAECARLREGIETIRDTIYIEGMPQPEYDELYTKIKTVLKFVDELLQVEDTPPDKE